MDMKYFKVQITTLLVGVFILTSCQYQSKSENDVSSMSTGDLIQLLKNPDDPENLFVLIVDELEKRGVAAAEAAPTLAKALSYPRRDSVIASRALIAMGQSAKSAIPDLIQDLENDRSDVRKYAAIVLGTIGKPADCTIPILAPLLWDPDPEVRSAVAAVLDIITGIDLVESTYEIDPTAPGILPRDDPDGIVSERAREWWLQTGKYMNWPTENCSPKS
jgi:HEAT repeats